MNKIIPIAFICLSVLLSSCGNSKKQSADKFALQSSDTGTAKILFTEYEHNFGKVAEGEKISWIFSFENKGTGNLVVTSATTTCGCTVPKYDTKPILPGSTGKIEVVFDTSGRDGMQTKTIAVKSNASVPVVLLKITAEVVTKEGA